MHKKGNYKKDSKFFNEKIILKGKHVEPMFSLQFQLRASRFSMLLFSSFWSEAPDFILEELDVVRV